MLTVTQVSQICKVKPRTVQMWIKDGRLDSLSYNDVFVFLNQYGLNEQARILKILVK